MTKIQELYSLYCSACREQYELLAREDCPEHPMQERYLRGWRVALATRAAQIPATTMDDFLAKVRLLIDIGVLPGEDTDLARDELIVNIRDDLPRVGLVPVPFDDPADDLDDVDEQEAA